MSRAFLERLAAVYPRAASLFSGPPAGLDEVQPPATDLGLEALERSLGIPLPESYKSLLRCGRGFWLLGGAVQFSPGHPYFHRFEPVEKLPPLQRAAVERHGGRWPPPSHGMLCFADFFMEADGDQVLFDVSGGLTGGEYPVMYYAHEGNPPSVRRLADGFRGFLRGSRITRCSRRPGEEPYHFGSSWELFSTTPLHLHRVPLL
jgi:hypothetical protein